jgi:hypothetical protein
MTKCFSIVLFLISTCGILLPSCENKQAEIKSSPKAKEAVRFEKLLLEAKLQNKDSFTYVVWNTTSCGGCRTTCVRLLQASKNKAIKLIAPLHFAGVTNSLSPQRLFIDTNGIFDKIYFGVDNIGLVKVYNNEVLSIRNYNPEAMDTFKADLEKIKSKLE